MTKHVNAIYRNESHKCSQEGESLDTEGCPKPIRAIRGEVLLCIGRVHVGCLITGHC